ncbi:hypothetical protein LIER_16711 [Lithospermum erythrorhizon]|uniref:BHLH domain-containing protein n=1 Tax=Lithospermum erythrorhizon TaxID=34254 RepID=A0AAV3Q938_LITER
MDVSEAIACFYNKQNSISRNIGMEVDLFSKIGQQPDCLASLWSQPHEESQSGQFWQEILESLEYSFNGSSNMILMPSNDNSNNLQPFVLDDDDHASVNVTKKAKRHAGEIENIVPRNNSIQHPMRHSSLEEQKMVPFQDHLNRQGKTSSPKKIPRKKCDKVANKITALQKIVSPYGKTDTASVLHEASIFIQVLLKEIQILTEENSQKKQVDLQTKGLCLVPVSIMKKYIDEESAAQDRFMSA